MWNSLSDSEFQKNTLVELLIENYEVDEVTARKDIDELVNSWIKAGIIVE